MLPVKNYLSLFAFSLTIYQSFCPRFKLLGLKSDFNTVKNMYDCVRLSLQVDVTYRASNHYFWSSYLASAASFK